MVFCQLAQSDAGHVGEDGVGVGDVGRRGVGGLVHTLTPRRTGRSKTRTLRLIGPPAL